MFNKVLTGIRNPRENRIEINYSATFDYEEHDDDDDEEDEDAETIRIRKQVKIPEFEAPPAPETVVNLNGRDLQVIVKLANIHLTPEQPAYPGKTSAFLPRL